MRLEKSLIYKSFYKDLAERYDEGATYTTDISDTRWMAYDIPGNIGWMTYLAMLVKMIRSREYGSAAVSAVPAALMITGVAELISERIEGLDRELPKNRLYRGFGALTLGGITGIAVSVITKSDKRTKCAMGGGAALCAVFAGLLLGGYRISYEHEQRRSRYGDNEYPLDGS